MKIKSQKNRSYIWLVTGSILMYFSNWNWAVPTATWLYSVFLLRYTRTQKAGRGLLVLCLASMFIGVVSMLKLLAIDAIPLSFRFVSGLAVGVVFMLPFIADRLFAYKIPGGAATLIFPFAWTACEYIKSLGGGSWGALAYTQYGNLPLMQMVSLTGIWGISFLITWFASIVNFAWEQQFKWQKVRQIAIFYSIIITLVFGYGFGRMATSHGSTDQVCIASITNPRNFISRFYKPDWTDRKLAYNSMNNDLDFFLNASKQSARVGAQVVLWQEYAMLVMEEHEQEFIKQAKDLAREENIYLAIAVGLFPLNYPDEPWQNKLIWINPNGQIINEYLKSKPAPPLEPIIPGNGKIPVFDTTYGKIASVICADLDYPSLIHQGGVSDADFLLIPAQDWSAVDPLHTNMSVFRAIENGVSMVKGTGGGLSIAVDPYGRIIDASDYFNSDQKPMITRLPTQGVGTLYALIGDAFAWLCILGIFIMSVWGILWCGKAPE